MDARELLNRVAETYAKLESFEVDILHTSESGDEDASRSSSHRSRGWFEAPHKVRWQQNSSRGIVMVTDGVDRHHYSGAMKHYSGGTVQPGQRLMGSFLSEHPLGGGMVFLFAGIAEKVAEAVVVKEEPEQVVVSVRYKTEPNPIYSHSVVLFTINSRSNLVLRMEGEATHQFPGQDESQTSREVSIFSHGFLNQPIPEATFQYVPPADAVDQSEQHRRSGDGTARRGPDGFETWHSSDWEGETFVDNFELKIRAMELKFERRLTFAGKDLEILETVSGPHGGSEHTCRLKGRLPPGLAAPPEDNGQISG
jgi:outer membrane lipoprotein-sorting protein